MSIQAMTWALAARTGKPGAKVVLLALANYADERGVCWPSQQRLAADTEQSIDTIQRRLKDLEASGLIERQRRTTNTGHRLADCYHLKMPKPQNAVLDENSQKKPDANTAHETSLNRTAAAYSKDEPPKEPSRKKLLSHRRIGGRGLAKKRQWERGKSLDPDRGEIEQSIAGRIGPEGWAVLMGLPDDEVRQLCAMQRAGRLTDARLDELRTMRVD
ncbi:MAG: helix-turn-helix domain-containing protein [Rhodobiaceae bacterium]|nr:helix-turn-helix domain-containing protein [Rhodobiaceae bacterium]